MTSKGLVVLLGAGKTSYAKLMRSPEAWLTSTEARVLRDTLRNLAMLSLSSLAQSLQSMKLLNPFETKDIRPMVSRQTHRLLL